MAILNRVEKTWARTITSVLQPFGGGAGRRGRWFVLCHPVSLPRAQTSGQRLSTTLGCEMGRRGKVRQIGGFVLYDVLYEDNTRTSNRKVPSLELNDIDGDLPAKAYIEAQDRKLAEVSGRPQTPIKSLTHSPRR
jgi:hypothetical protein